MVKSWRDNKREARRVTHKRMSHPIVYFDSTHSLGVDLYARIHRDFGQTGGIKGISMQGVEVFEENPTSIFFKQDLSDSNIILKKGGIVSVLEKEFYEIKEFKPSDDEFIICQLMRIPASQASAYRWQHNVP